MNTEVYNYVYSIANKIKNKSDKEDVAQEVLLILCRKNLVETELTEGLKNYIKGIVWNYSTTLYNQFNQDTFYINSTFDQIDSTEDEINESNFSNEVLRKVKNYVYQNYFIKGRNLNRWRVFYLWYRGYNYDYISNRLKINRRSCVEYTYLNLKELKQNLLCQ
ncbi:sigma-70 family RNA polymerase sigma factor [Algoriphagus sp. AK58]|uniref:sigma-70 family RNA polymerase sigma factor n=1 Tax=Algoriphagus sp. AK58 TaxID=1406877 RepID=UPI00164FBB83|nr:sigma-70 family RNA polymerase sigma factor [Algoriphagus sp. AK58]MBC6365786.1 hypothetical protein [Algoriphagus sp. AK58]